MLQGSANLLLVPMNETDVIEAFAQAVSGKVPMALLVPTCDPPIPQDAEVRAVHHDYFTRQFFFVLMHDSFPPVPHGEMIPRATVGGTVTLPDAVVG